MDEQKFSQNLDSSLSVESVIKEFGGIRPMAAKLGIPVTTVQGWKSHWTIAFALICWLQCLSQVRARVTLERGLRKLFDRWRLRIPWRPLRLM